MVAYDRDGFVHAVSYSGRYARREGMSLTAITAAEQAYSYPVKLITVMGITGSWKNGVFVTAN